MSSFNEGPSKSTTKSLPSDYKKIEPEETLEHYKARKEKLSKKDAIVEDLVKLQMQSFNEKKDFKELIADYILKK